MIAAEPKQYASDGTRWYRQDGTSVEDTLAKNGNPRAVTLRDARKPENQFIPSVTSVIQVMAKPGLDRWKLEQVALAAIETNQFDWNENTPPEEAIPVVLLEADTRMSKARDEGSEVHGQIDRWLLSEFPVQEVLSPHVMAAGRALDELGVSGHPKHVEKTFCAKFEDVWISGKADLHYECGFLVDWKTSNKVCDGTEKMGYDEHVIQMAAYSVALFGRLAHCHNVYLSTQVPGNYQIRTWTPEELSRGLAMYTHLFKLWCLRANYFPGTRPPVVP